MSNRERRRADRVEVGLPVQIFCKRGFVSAEVRDLSRGGLRIRARCDDMGFGPTTDLIEAARGVAARLRPTFTLELNYKSLGPLLQRGVSLTRVGLPVDAPGHVELCCEFDEHLSDEDAATLGTYLPPMREASEATTAWVPDADVPRDCAGDIKIEPARNLRVHEPSKHQVSVPPGPPGRPRQRYRALVRGCRRNAPPTHYGYTDLVTAFGVRVAFPRTGDTRGVSAAARAFTDLYGSELELRIVGEAGDVWSGPVRASGAELPPDRPEIMLVTLAFARPMTLTEMRALGLVRQSA